MLVQTVLVRQNPITNCGPPTTADTDPKTTSVSSASKSLTYVASKIPSVLMVKTWKELRVESRALAPRWTSNVITATADPFLETVIANWMNRLIRKRGRNLFRIIKTISAKNMGIMKSLRVTARSQTTSAPTVYNLRLKLSTARKAFPVSSSAGLGSS